MININQLKTFSMVVREGSMSAAGEKLSLTQPTVSQHIQNVSDFFGVSLLNRRGKEMEPTPVGKIIFEEANKLISAYDQFEEHTFSEVFRTKNQIVIGAGPLMTDHIIPHMMGFFKKTHQDIDLVVNPMNADSVVKGIIDHSLDVGFLGYNVKNSKLQLEEWITDDLILITPVDHPFTKREYICLDDLKSQKFVWHKDYTGLKMFFDEKIKQAGKNIHINMTIIVSSTLSVLNSVHAGLGISLISRRVAEKSVESGMIATVPIKDVPMRRILYITTHRLKRMPPIVQSFLDASKNFEEQFES